MKDAASVCTGVLLHYEQIDAPERGGTLGEQLEDAEALRGELLGGRKQQGAGPAVLPPGAHTRSLFSST